MPNESQDNTDYINMPHGWWAFKSKAISIETIHTKLVAIAALDSLKQFTFSYDEFTTEKVVTMQTTLAVRAVSQRINRKRKEAPYTGTKTSYYLNISYSSNN
mmetsp:Transcript_13515/g.16097  ORF Transcript_13515/g.16097 Transcript_13515/m.16097 type:complete len:102 (+) Transcript_13515:395-700(+)